MASLFGARDVVISCFSMRRYAIVAGALFMDAKLHFQVSTEREGVMAEMASTAACSSVTFGDADVEEILYSEQAIHERVAQIGQQITEDYRDVAFAETPHGDPAILMVSVLRGAAIYMSDLARQINLPFEMDYMAVSSYGTGTKSSGVVRILKDLTSNIEGRHVIIAEDIVDSGLTLKYLLRVLESRNPASITIAALLKKQNPEQAEIDCKYVGFECPGAFIVGYGLDYAERYRNLPYIGILKPEVYQGK